MSQEQIRAVLRANPDGLTRAQIEQKTGKTRGVKLVCLNMPDVYIDRWIKTKRGPAKYTPIYVAVDVPDDAPMPD